MIHRPVIMVLIVAAVATVGLGPASTRQRFEWEPIDGWHKLVLCVFSRMAVLHRQTSLSVPPTARKQGQNGPLSLESSGPMGIMLT